MKVIWTSLRRVIEDFRILISEIWGVPLRVTPQGSMIAIYLGVISVSGIEVDGVVCVCVCVLLKS